MKKFFLFLACGLISSAVMVAQDDCMTLFPNNPGAVIVNKTYDAGDNLISSMVYRVATAYDYPSGTDMMINFTMTDKNGVAIDEGKLNANCMDGAFQLKMTNMGMTSEIMSNLTTDTELVGDFLDYPNPFDDSYVFDSPFQMDGGSYTLQSKNDKKDWASVRVYNRQYEKNEDVTVPAKATPFHAAKVTFVFEVTKDKNTTKYRGVEWYAPNAGIVRSETYDANNNLINYTVLSQLTDK